MAAAIEALAQRLAGAGVRRGDRVALTLPNGPDFVLLLLAITALGAAAAPLNPAYTQAEFDFFLTDIAPRLFLIPASRPAAAAGAAAGTRTPVLTVGAAADGPPELLDAGGAAARPQRSVRARRPRRRGRRAAHQRNDQPAQAGPAAPAEPDGLGPHDRRALPARSRPTSRSA